MRRLSLKRQVLLLTTLSRWLCSSRIWKTLQPSMPSTLSTSRVKQNQLGAALRWLDCPRTCFVRWSTYAFYGTHGLQTEQQADSMRSQLDSLLLRSDKGNNVFRYQLVSMNWQAQLELSALLAMWGIMCLSFIMWQQLERPTLAPASCRRYTMMISVGRARQTMFSGQFDLLTIHTVGWMFNRYVLTSIKCEVQKIDIRNARTPMM